MDNQRRLEAGTLGGTAGCLAGCLGELLAVGGGLYYGIFLQPAVGNPHNWDFSTGLAKTLLYMAAAGLGWLLLWGILFRFGPRLLGRRVGDRSKRGSGA